MIKTSRIVVTGLLAVTLAACGGSGDSNDSGTAAAPTAQITSANASAIAGATLKSALEGGDLGSFADLSGTVGGTSVQKPTTLYSKVGQIQVQELKPMLTESQIGTFQATIDPVESPCAVSGSTTVSGDIQDPQTLSANDVINVEFTDCYDGVVTVDGLMSITVLQFSGDFVSGSFSFEVSVDLTDFTVTAADETQTANGDLSIGLSILNNGPVSMTIESDSLTVTNGTSTSTLTNYALTQSIDTVTGDYDLSLSGRLDSSAFDGVVDFTTNVDLSGIGEEPAFTGEVVITGDANATITVVVLDGQLLRLDVDLDGDGNTDESIDSSWAELV